MKKLMIAAAIVCAAVMSQAATYKWAANGVKGPLEDSGLYTGSAVLHIFVGKSAGEIGSEFLVNDAGSMSAGVITLTAQPGLTKDEYYTAFYTMETTIDGKTYMFQSGNKTGKGLDEGKDLQFNFTSTGSWTPVAVPEPTSGLLLLLGVAGLALRRRRA